MNKRYWLTPPDFYEALNSEFHFDFDPCPCPRPEGYNSLALPWGKSNYVNPPFLTSDAPYGGPSAVMVLPLPWNIHLLMAAGAEIRYAGQVRWLEVDSGEECKRNAPQVVAVLRPEQRAVDISSKNNGQ